MKNTKHQAVDQLPSAASHSSINLGIAILDAAASSGQPLTPAVAAAIADVLRGVSAPIAMRDETRQPAADVGREAPLPLFSVAERPALGASGEQIAPRQTMAPPASGGDTVAPVGARGQHAGIGTASDDGEWITAREFAGIFGVNMQGGKSALRGCYAGRTWRGVHLTVRIMPRPEKNGVQYEVLRSTLQLVPIELPPPAEDRERWLTVSQASHALGVSEHSVHYAMGCCSTGRRWRGVLLKARRVVEGGRHGRSRYWLIEKASIASLLPPEPAPVTPPAPDAAPRKPARLTARAATPAAGVH
jgi:hypothetical protein